MSGLSRCGRVYHSLDEAVKAAEQRTFKTDRPAKVIGCSICGDWHVIEPKEVIGKQKRYRPDPFPPPVQKLIDKRDEWRCQRCGFEGRLERHHRRAKGSGGSKARAHSQCTCNALSLCRRCHEFVHAHPTVARQMGWIVSQSVSEPRKVAVLRYLIAPLLAADVFFATCNGQWVDCQAETEDS